MGLEGQEGLDDPAFLYHSLNQEGFKGPGGAQATNKIVHMGHGRNNPVTGRHGYHVDQLGPVCNDLGAVFNEDSQFVRYRPSRMRLKLNHLERSQIGMANGLVAVYLQTRVCVCRRGDLIAAHESSCMTSLSRFLATAKPNPLPPPLLHTEKQHAAELPPCGGRGSRMAGH